MTEKQRALIMYLDDLCAKSNLNVRASDNDMLGKEWFRYYKNITYEYTDKVIEKLKMALGMEHIHKKRGTNK